MQSNSGGEGLIRRKLKNRELYTPEMLVNFKKEFRLASQLGFARHLPYYVETSYRNNEDRGNIYYFENQDDVSRFLQYKGVEKFPIGTISKKSEYSVTQANVSKFLKSSLVPSFTKNVLSLHEGKNVNKKFSIFKSEAYGKKDDRRIKINNGKEKDRRFAQKIQKSDLFGDLN